MPSLWDTFTGADKAKRQAVDTYNNNQASLKAGYGGMKDAYGQGYTQATNRLGSYSQQGQQANAQYGNLLGLNGGGAQQGAMGAYNAYNPYLQAEQGRITQGLRRRAAMEGNLGSGLNALAQARALDESSFRNYTDYMNRLQGQGQMGLGVDSTLAGLDMGNAANMAGAEQWFRGGQIGNQTQTGNALAAANISPMNALMGFGQMAIGAMRPSPTMGGANNLAYSQPGNAMNGGWSTTAYRA